MDAEFNNREKRKRGSTSYSIYPPDPRPQVYQRLPGNEPQELYNRPPAAEPPLYGPGPRPDNWVAPRTQKIKYMPKRRRYSRRPRVDLRDPALYAQMIAEQHDTGTARGSDTSIARYGKTIQLATTAQRANRLRYGYKGQGDYATDWKPWLQRWVPKGSLSALGGWAGGALGGAPGAAFGSTLGSAGASYLGWGRYKRRKNLRGRGDYGGFAGGNQIIGGAVDTPMTVNSSSDLSGDIYLSHREFLGNVTATGGPGNISSFSNVSYPLNAGIIQTFPWLSQIAQNFIMYELIGCIFEFKPTSGEFGATGTNTLGKVVMATQYDPDQPSFTSTVQMENYDYSNACKPSEGMIHGIETDPKQRATKMMYIRTGASTKDLVFTDYGNFQIATEGLPITNGVSANVGELWVAYKVKLSRAQLFGSLLNNNCMVDYFWGRTSAAPTNNSELDLSTTYVAAQTAGSKYQTTGLALNQACPKLTNTIGCTVTNFSAGPNYLITFPKNIITGTYMIQVQLIAATATALGGLTIAPTSFTNCAVSLSTALANGNGFTPSPSTTGQTQAGSVAVLFFVTVTAPGNLQATINVAATGYPATIHSTNILIMQCAASLLQ